jgi:hypothetical protein
VTIQIYRTFGADLVRSASDMKGIIYVKRTMREQTRRRFTIAHEIGDLRFTAISCGPRPSESNPRFPSGEKRGTRDSNPAQWSSRSCAWREIVPTPD